MNSEVIINRIKKLLRLGASPNSHEAELALERAFDLAARYKVDLEGLELDDDTKRILHERVPLGLRVPFERRLAMNIAAMFFNVNIILSTGSYIVVGTPPDVAVAVYVVDFLVNTVRQLLRAYKRREAAARRRMSPRKRAGFIQGFFYGIISQLDSRTERLSIEEPKTALVLRDAKSARDKYANQQFELKDISPLRLMTPNRGALMTGYVAGRRASISRGLSSSARPKPLMAA